MTVKQLQRQKAAKHRFSLELYAAKKEAGLSLNAIGERVGLSGNRVKQLLDNPDCMTLAQLGKLSDVLKVFPTTFLVAYGFQQKEEF